MCRIAAVGPSSLSGTDKTKLYYTLTPLTRSGTVLTPVDTKVLMRPILTRQEAEDFIAQLPQLPPEEPESRSMRLLKEFYQQIVTSYDGPDPLRRPPPQARPADRAQGQPDGRALPAPGGERSLR